jgi:hypothetical protein
MKKRLGIVVMLLIFLGMVVGFVALVSGETEEFVVMGLPFWVFLAAFAYSLPKSGAETSAPMNWAQRNRRKEWSKTIMRASAVVGLPALLISILFIHQADDTQKRIDHYPHIEDVPTFLLRSHSVANFRENVSGGVCILSICVLLFGVVIYPRGTNSSANGAQRTTFNSTVVAAAAAVQRTPQGQGKRVLWFVLKSAVSLYLMAGGGELMYYAAKYAVLNENNTILILAGLVYMGFAYWGYRVIWVPIEGA